MAVTRTSTGLWAAPAISIDNIWRGGAIEGSHSVNSFGQTTWPSANFIIYTPVLVKARVIAVELWYGGSAVSGGNLQLGIYQRNADGTGTKLVETGSSAKGAVNGRISVDITDTTLSPGLYYVAMQGDGGAGTYTRTAPTAPNAATLGYRTEAAGSFTLPSTPTWIIGQTLAYIPTCGIALDTAL